MDQSPSTTRNQPGQGQQNPTSKNDPSKDAQCASSPDGKTPGRTEPGQSQQEGKTGREAGSGHEQGQDRRPHQGQNQGQSGSQGGQGQGRAEDAKNAADGENEDDESTDQSGATVKDRDQKSTTSKDGLPSGEKRSGSGQGSCGA